MSCRLTVQYSMGVMVSDVGWTRSIAVPVRESRLLTLGMSILSAASARTTRWLRDINIVTHVDRNQKC